MLPPNGSGKFPAGLSMLGWALNEEMNVGGYVERAGAFLEALTDDYELVLLDDGSTDRTWEVARACQETRPWLRLYRNDRNRGPGYNTKRALSLATKDYVFWQTVDWSYDLGQLGEFLPWLGHYDALQGVREGTLSWRGILGRRSDNAWKGVVSAVNYFLIRLMFRLPLHDYQNVTVYPRELIQSVRLETESSFTNPECLLKTWWKGARFKEFPVPFLKRQRGQAKGTRARAILASVTDIGSWWFRWVVLGRRADRGRGEVAPWAGDGPAAPGGQAHDAAPWRRRSS
jgi:hypothetical protein